MRMGVVVKMSRTREAGLLVVLLLGLGLAGCQRYGQVEPRTYEYAQALVAAASAQQEDRLAALKAKVMEDRELDDRGRGYLLSIVAVAEQGQWDAAAIEARRLMKEQVR
jgi:hypothetical protein